MMENINTDLLFYEFSGSLVGTQLFQLENSKFILSAWQPFLKILMDSEIKGDFWLVSQVSRDNSLRW